jgi:hypothetical protein
MGIKPKAEDVKVKEAVVVEKKKGIAVKVKVAKKKVETKAVAVVIEKKDTKAIDAELALENQDRKQLVEELYKKVPQLFSEAQRRLILNETPRYVIKQRKGKGGIYFDYVDTGYVIEQLNLLTGFHWDTQILSDLNSKDYWDVAEKFKQVGVHLKLTAHAGKNTRCIEDVGRADLKTKTDGTGYLDVWNDVKSAVSDAIKRCARQMGIALDVYSGAVKRAQDENHPEHKITEGQRKRLEALANEATIGHSGLKKLINEMYDYETTTDIQRRHFEPIQQRVALLVSEKTVEPEMPEDIIKGFEILGTPKAKRIATFNAYKAKGEVGLTELKNKMNAEADRREAERLKKEEEGKS